MSEHISPKAVAVAVPVLLAALGALFTRFWSLALIVALAAGVFLAWPVLRRVRLRWPLSLAGKQPAANPKPLDRKAWVVGTLRLRAQEGDRLIDAPDSIFREWANATADLIDAAVYGSDGAILRNTWRNRERALRDVRALMRKVELAERPGLIRPGFDPRTYVELATDD